MSKYFWQNSVCCVGKPICGKWSDVCLLWAKAYWDPQEDIWSTPSACFRTSSYIMFFLLSLTPPSHRQAGRYFFLFFPSNTSIYILNMSRKWLPPQLLSPCLADMQGMSVNVTPTKYTPRCGYRCAACVTRNCSTNGCHWKPHSVSLLNSDTSYANFQHIFDYMGSCFTDFEHAI